MTIISDLDDNCFVITSEFFAEISKEIEAAVNRKPTIDELCELLTLGLKGGKEILYDISVNNIESIKAVYKKKKIIHLKPGDQIAIPAKNGLWYHCIYITENRFGWAYGFFQGTWPFRSFDFTNLPKPILPPIYSGSRFIQNGKWKIVGHFPELLSYFPQNPEIYHQKKHNQDNNKIGRFGSAETADNKLRMIDEQEAKLVGILDNCYRSSVMEEYLEGYLSKLTEFRKEEK